MNPKPSQILIPDLFSYCTFSIHINPHAERAVAESKDWFLAEMNLSDSRKAAFCGLKAGGQPICVHTYNRLIHK
jgi:hypothetical protein